MMGEAFPAQILVATDGSKEAELLKGTGAELHVSHVWRSLPHYAYCPPPLGKKQSSAPAARPRPSTGSASAGRPDTTLTPPRTQYSATKGKSEKRKPLI